MTIVHAREYALSLIEDVLEGQSLSDAFVLPSFLNFPAQEQSWIKAASLGTCRYYFALHALLKPRLQKPFKSKDRQVEIILIAALHELLCMNTPDYACVSQYVSITEKYALWAKGLVNAILRGVLRDNEKNKINILQFNRHPEWWTARVQHDWPAECELILNEDQNAPPFILRINKNKTSWNEYQALLTQENLQATAFHTPITELNETAMDVSPAVAVQQLPKFSDGFVSVQDVSGQFAAFLLNPTPGMHVLDACAAPGGKTAHLLERFPDILLTAIDVDQRRTQRIKENISRLQLNASTQIIIDNALNVDDWWDNTPFDRILLDAPCSASGVVRRHPDIKLLREDQDIAKLADTQLQLLISLWPTLAGQGELLYSTCSIFKEENDAVIQAFLAQEPTARSVSLPEIGITSQYGQQLLPGIHQGDGFYYAKLKKAVS